MSLFRFFRIQKRRQIVTRIRVEFTLYARDVEYIVARHKKPIPNKQALKDLIALYLKDNGRDFPHEIISDDPEEVEAALAKARPIVTQFMPEFYNTSN